MHGAAVALALIIALGRAHADPRRPAAVDATAHLADAQPAEGSATAALEALGDGDHRVVERAVAEIAAGAPEPDRLFAAARACEDKLADPARAIALYARVVAEFPDARVAVAAGRRLAALRPLVGANGETARLAAELAYLTAHADAEPAAAVLARGAALTEAAWPGAPDAALWLAGWLHRAGRLVEAQARYAVVTARWPGTPAANEAVRGAATCALDARDWTLADQLVRRLPTGDPAARGVRDDLRAAAARGALRQRWYVRAWLALGVALAGLLGSLADAARRSLRGARLAMLRPPIDAIFLAPIAAVLIGVAFTAHRLIAPAVATITLGGVALTWLSGAGLERLRELGRPIRARALLHIALCLVSVVALSYIALTRDHLLDLLIETVRFGPET